MLTKHKSVLSVEQKYWLYEHSVQNVEADVDFILKTFKELNGKRAPKVLREDFCGTGALMCEWVRRSPERVAFGLDLDNEPMNYGKHHHLTKLPAKAQARVEYQLQNVLSARNAKADVITAFNFSYYFFKERNLLKKYFASIQRSLNKEGLFFIDLFGGTDCFKELEESTKHATHTYFWHCQRFDPVTNYCHYSIHFKYKGFKYTDVYTYDWRHWTVNELIDLMYDAGFSKATCYWEGEEEDGSGNGVFTPAKAQKNCPSWIAYIVAQK